NLAVDHKLAFLNSKVSVEFVHSINDNTLFIANDNLKARGIAADGRVYFFGSPGSSNATFAQYPNYLNIYHIRNVTAGKSTYAVVSWEREMKNNWAFTLSYTRGKST